MGREIRIGLLLAAASCLMAVMVDWVVEELTSQAPQFTAEAPQASSQAPQAPQAPQASETERASVGVPQQDTGGARDATEVSYGQG
jgi:hypothetical protein